jgi:hypothetical protein
VNRKELAAMKKEVVRALKPFLTWNYLHQKNSPNGAWVTARIERVEQTMYCGLIGKPHDPQLCTLVKKGAWYQVPVILLVGVIKLYQMSIAHGCFECMSCVA